MDIDSGQELKYNEVGEIWISGPSIMLGYYKNEEATSEIISEDEKGQKWIRTGDLGCMNEDGLLFHKGRIRRIYLTSVMGQPAKIFPNMVEQIINRQAGVEESAVVGRYIENSAYYEPVGFIVLKDKSMEHKVVEEQVRESCEKELPPYMIPVEYRFVEKLPYTSVGKVDFRKLETEAENRT
jgi:long-chain acyl-CoA synthetase